MWPFRVSFGGLEWPVVQYFRWPFLGPSSSEHSTVGFRGCCFVSLAELSRLPACLREALICCSKALFCSAALLHPLPVLSGL